MADVMLDLDADHAATLSRAIGFVAGEKWWDVEEDRAVLAAIRDVIDRQLAPEVLP